MLHQAAIFAGNSKDCDKSFYLACFAMRADGVLVKSTNNTVIWEQTPSSHAEARVLKKSGVGAVLWVARVLKDRKTWAMAKPCSKCQALIENKLVSRVYYTIGPNEYGIWDPNR